MKQRSIDVQDNAKYPLKESQLISIKAKRSYSFYYSIPGFIAFDYKKRPVLTLTDQMGKTYRPSSMSNTRISSGSHASYLVGSIELEQGEYNLEVEKEFISTDVPENAMIEVTSASIMMLIAAIFCFVLPSLALLFVVISRLLS